MIGDGLQFHFEVEQAIKGQPTDDKRILYHFYCNRTGLSWEALMKQPYRVTICDMTIYNIERLIAESKKPKEGHGNAV